MQEAGQCHYTVEMSKVVEPEKGFTYALDRMNNVIRWATGDSQTSAEIVSEVQNLKRQKGYKYKVSEEGDVVKHQTRVVALHLLRRSNDAQMRPLFQLLHRMPSFIHAYLQEFIFPQFMRHKRSKLSASGQELGGSLLFGRRIGFSGTPSDLLPSDLGRCGFAEEDEGQIITTLSSADIVAAEKITDKSWTVELLLQRIAQSTSPVYHALIDTGALITGMSNVEVARYLLRHGLGDRGIEGVVFLDERDRKMVLVKETNRVVKLEECGIGKDKRFAFYDQVG